MLSVYKGLLLIPGTGFRTKSNLDQLVGGSCNNIDKQGQGKLRLKVYVCTPEEVKQGRCEMCPSAGCYYKSILDLLVFKLILDYGTVTDHVSEIMAIV